MRSPPFQATAGGSSRAGSTRAAPEPTPARGPPHSYVGRPSLSSLLKRINLLSLAQKIVRVHNQVRWKALIIAHILSVGFMCVAPNAHALCELRILKACVYELTTSLCAFPYEILRGGASLSVALRDPTSEAGDAEIETTAFGAAAFFRLPLEASADVSFLGMAGGGV